MSGARFLEVRETSTGGPVALAKGGSATGVVFSTPRIGSINHGSAGLFTGDVAEILLYAGKLSDADRDAVEAYLHQKYLGAAPSPPGGQAPAELVQRLADAEAAIATLEQRVEELEETVAAHAKPIGVFWLVLEQEHRPGGDAEMRLFTFDLVPGEGERLGDAVQVVALGRDGEETAVGDLHPAELVRLRVGRDRLKVVRDDANVRFLVEAWAVAFLKGSEAIVVDPATLADAGGRVAPFKTHLVLTPAGWLASPEPSPRR